MSLKYNRFLLNTCLPVVATLCLITAPALAGFEWTPPEQQQSQPLPEADNSAVLPQPDSQMPPVQPQPRVVDTGAPVMKVKVIGETPEQAQKQEMLTPTPTQNNTPVMQHQSAPIQNGLETSEQPQPEHQEPIVQTETKKDGLSINPYPLKEGTEQTTKAAQPVLLPEDPTEDVSAMDTLPTASAPEQTAGGSAHPFPVIEGFGTDMPLVIALTQIVPPDYAYSFGTGVNAGTLVSWEGGKPWNEVLASVIIPLGIDLKILGKTISLTSRNAPPIMPVSSADEGKQTLNDATPKTKAEDILAQDPQPEETHAENPVIVRGEPTQSSTAHQEKTNIPQEISEQNSGIQAVTPEDSAATQPPADTLNSGVSRKSVTDPGAEQSVQPVSTGDTAAAVEKKKRY